LGSGLKITSFVSHILYIPFFFSAMSIYHYQNFTRHIPFLLLLICFSWLSPKYWLWNQIGWAWTPAAWLDSYDHGSSAPTICSYIMGCTKLGTAHTYFIIITVLWRSFLQNAVKMSILHYLTVYPSLSFDFSILKLKRT
jgi:hypothetical protein